MTKKTPKNANIQGATCVACLYYKPIFAPPHADFGVCMAAPPTPNETTRPIVYPSRQACSSFVEAGAQP
jgi:hypothetical protein